MKTHNPVKQWSLILPCFFLLSLAGCNKSSVTPETDPGYGCSTQAVLETIPSTAAKLIYVPAQSQWMISLDLSGSIYIACLTCGNSSIIDNISAGHPLTDVININVSGKIKNRIENQVPISSCTGGGYREIYLMDVITANQ